MAELHQIVLHELEHLRRRDDWTNLLQKLALILFPLNPVLVWVERRLCVERELACDDHVLHATGSKAYATCLTNLAERGLLRRGVSLALGAWQRQSELSRRVHRILRSPQTAARGTHPAAVGTCVAAVTIGAVLLAIDTPQLVTFGARSTIAQSASAPPAISSVYPTLIRAALPWPNPAPPTLRAAAAPHHAHRRAGALRVTTFPRYQQRHMNAGVVLIEWRPTAARSRRLLVQQPSFVLAYAALPSGSGWLVFQL